MCGVQYVYIQFIDIIEVRAYSYEKHQRLYTHACIYRLFLLVRQSVNNNNDVCIHNICMYVCLFVCICMMNIARNLCT